MIRRKEAKAQGFKVLEEIEYPESVSAIMNQDNSSHAILDHAIKEGEVINLYIVNASNASYWKTDGQVYASHVYALNKKSDEAFTVTVLTAYTQSELIEHTKALLLRTQEYNEEYFNTRYPEWSKNYPWQCAKGGRTLK